MKFFATEEFIDTYKSLIRKKSYKSLKSNLIKDFLQEDPDLLATGALLGTKRPPTYLKRRIGGSSGYRIYYLLFPNKFVIIGYIHPKFGSKGAQNISENGLEIVLSEILKSFKDDNLLEVKLVGKPRRKHRKQKKSFTLTFTKASIEHLK